MSATIRFWIDLPDPIPPYMRACVLAVTNEPVTAPMQGYRRFAFKVQFPVRATEEGEMPTGVSRPEEIFSPSPRQGESE